MNLQSFLDEKGVAYRLSRHETAFTASGLAQVEHVPGRKVIKPVIVNADGQFVMCALPASHKIDFEELKRQLEANYVSMVSEEKLGELRGGESGVVVAEAVADPHLVQVRL